MESKPLPTRIPQRTLRAGLIVAILGAFLPLAVLPFTDGHSSRGSLLSNIRAMRVPIRDATREPEFNAAPPGYPTANLQIVEFPGGAQLAFPRESPEHEIRAAVDIVKDRVAKERAGVVWVFGGWREAQAAIALPFRFVVLASVVMLCAGAILVVLALTAPKREGVPAQQGAKAEEANS